MLENLFHKTDRHDNSMTEQEKIEFRKSEEWRYFRNQVAEHQNYKDFITGEPLTDDWNCHHCCMINSQYKNLVLENFIAVNKNTHKKIHELFKPGWKDTVQTNDPFYKVLDKMDKLNDDVEIVLYDNRIDYQLTNPGDKYRNMTLAKTYHYPINDKGYLQWNKRYIPNGVPQDTMEWTKWISKENNNSKLEFMQLMLELRHINLYSSYKNFRNNPCVGRTTKEECRKELETTTKILKAVYNYK